MAAGPALTLLAACAKIERLQGGHAQLFASWPSGESDSKIVAAVLSVATHVAPCGAGPGYLRLSMTARQGELPRQIEDILNP
jgi:hypothetical protein